MIQVSNIEEIKEEDVPKLVQKIIPELNSRKELWKRIHRKSKLCELVFNDNKTKITFEKYIWLIASGFLGGKAPVYSVSDTIDAEKEKILADLFDKKVKENNYKKSMEVIIDYITKFNDDSTEHYDLMRDVLGLRGAYELIYENDKNEIVYASLDPLQTVAIYDYKVPKNLIGFIRIYEEENANSSIILKVEIIDKKGMRIYQSEAAKDRKELEKKKFKIKKEESKEHNWGDVPGFAVEIGESIFESVVDIINEYEKLIKNTSNMFDYNDEAKLAIFGYEPENDMFVTKQINDKTTGELIEVEVENPLRAQEDKKVLESKTLYFPTKEGNAKWILKDINDNAIQNTLKTFIDLILMLAGVPNTFDLGFTNADNASAIDRKFFSLVMMTIEIISKFTQGYKRRWELIINRINLKKNTNFDFRDISVDLPANLPANESEVIDMWLKLRGLASDETITERMGLGLDYTNEQNKIDEQNKKNIQNNYNNLKEGTKKDNKKYEVNDNKIEENSDNTVLKEE